MHQTETPEALADMDQSLPEARTTAESIILDSLRTGVIPTNAAFGSLDSTDNSVAREADIYRLVRDFITKPDQTEDDLIGPEVFDAVSDYMKHEATRHAFHELVVEKAPNRELIDHAAEKLIDIAVKHENPIQSINDYTRILKRTQDPDLCGRSLKQMIDIVPKFNMTEPNGIKNALGTLQNVSNALKEDPDLAAYPGITDALVVLGDHEQLNIAMPSRHLVIAYADDQDVKAEAAEKLLNDTQKAKQHVVRYNDCAHVVHHVTDDKLCGRAIEGMIDAMAHAADGKTLFDMTQGLDNSLRVNADNRAANLPAVRRLLNLAANHPNPHIKTQALVLGMQHGDESTLPGALEAAIDLAEKQLVVNADISAALLVNSCRHLDEKHPLSERAIALTMDLMQSNKANVSMYAIIDAEHLVPEGDQRAVHMQERWAELYETLAEPRSRVTITAMALQAARPNGPLASYAAQLPTDETKVALNIDGLFGTSDYGESETSPLSDQSYGFHRSSHSDGSPRARVNRNLQGQLHGLQVTFDHGDGVNMDGDARSVTWLEHGKVDRDKTALLRENLSALDKTPNWGDMTSEQRNAVRAQTVKSTLG